MCGDKADPGARVDPPEIVTLGKGRSVRDAVRLHGQERDIPPEEIESFLEEIQRSRSHNHHFKAIEEGMRPARWLLVAMLLVILCRVSTCS
jgi:hypothetical protein